MASTSAKDSDGVLNESLESMKRTKSGHIGHVTKFQSEIKCEWWMVRCMKLPLRSSNSMKLCHDA